MKKKPKEQDLKVILPNNFSADQILAPLGMRKDFHTNLKAGMFFILDNLIKMSQTRRWRDYYDEHGGYPLHSTILNQVVGKKYTTVIDLLVKSGVVKRTKGYQAGKQTKLFALSEKHSSAGYKIRPLSKDASLYKRLLEYQTEQKLLNDAALAKIKYVTKWFDPQRLTLDKKQAHSLIEFYMAEMNALIPDPLPTGRSLEEIETRINHRVNSMIDTFNSVEEGYMGLKKTGKDNRLHSVVSNTKKELRSLYRFDKKTLVSIDLKASQPYLLSQLLKPKSWGEKGLVARVFPKLYSKISSRKYNRLLDTILMFGTFSITHTGKGFQGTGFFKFKWNTDFYQHLVGLAKAEGAEKVFPNRSAVKKKMMMILFDDGAYMQGDAGFKLFQKWFPSEAAIVSLLKTISRETKASDPDDTSLNFLPILLQRMESYLILEKVCKKISKELPDAPIIPVHDCIMTSVDFADKVEEVVKKVLKKETSLEPGVTKEQGTSSIRKKSLGNLAAEDLHEILDKKSKGKHTPSGIKSPLLFEPPDLEGDWLVYHRFDIDGIPFEGERIFHIVDDRNPEI
jgi:hypothetical protein